MNSRELTKEQIARIGDIVRLLPSAAERRAYLDLLAAELEGHDITDVKLRLIATRVWHKHLRSGSSHQRPGSAWPDEIG